MSDVLAVLRNRRIIALGLLAVLCAVVFVRLADWQAHRSTELHAQSQDFHDNVTAPAVQIETLLGPDGTLPAADEFRAVTATGTYDTAAQVLVRSRTQNGANGLIVAVPLRTTDGPWLWVVRGWIPAGSTSTARLTAPAPPVGTVTVSGIARPSEDAPAVGVRPADLPEGQVTALAVPELSAALPGSAYGAILQADLEDPAPAQGIEPLAPPEGIGGGLQQLSYAVQWVIFAIIAIVGFFLIVRLEARARRNGPDDQDESAPPFDEGGLPVLPTQQEAPTG